MSFKRFRRIVFRWLLLAALILAAVAIGLTGWRLLNSYERAVLPAGYDLAVSAKPASGVTNIALFGVDYSDGQARRSDCIMVLSVDADHDAIRLVSLMRDSQVEVDDVGTTKLNHAYAYGGPALAIRTINQTFDLDIEHYATVNFVQMAQMIDALGGVTIDVHENEVEETNKFILEYCRTVGQANCPIESAGVQELNGAQAMSYARIRKNGTGDDWGRVERQGIVLEAMFDKVQSSSAAALIDLAPKLLPYVTTDLSVTEIGSLVLGVFSGGKPAISHARVPADGEWSYGGKSNAYIVYDTDLAARRIERYFYEGITPAEQIAEENGKGGDDTVHILQ